MKSIVIQLGAILAFVGLFASRTVAAERSNVDELYSESVYVEKGSAETPTSISDQSKPVKPKGALAKNSSSK